MFEHSGAVLRLLFAGPPILHGTENTGPSANTHEIKLKSLKMATHARNEIPTEKTGAKGIAKKTASNRMVPEGSKVPAGVKVFRAPNITARGPLGEVGNKPLGSKAEPSANIAGTTTGTLKYNLPVVRKKVKENNLTELVKPLSNINVKEDKSKVATDRTNDVLPTSYSSKQLVDVLDVDESSQNDPHCVSTYIKDIMRYLLELEKRHTITQNYLLNGAVNHGTTPQMRSVLVNWMVEVQVSFRFLPETLHLSVAITDRYLQQQPSVGRTTLQLVGTAALFIAVKYEEVYPPEMSEFVSLCDDTFSKGQMLQMEWDILTQVNFELGCPLSLHFLWRYNKIADVDFEHHVLGKYLLELALVDHRVSHVFPSLQAAAACFLSLAALGTAHHATGNRTNRPTIYLSRYWTKTLVHHTTYSFGAIVPHVRNLARLLGEAPTSKYKAVRIKYAAHDLKKISMHAALRSAVVKWFANLAQI